MSKFTDKFNKLDKKLNLRPIDIISWLFVIYMLTFYLIHMDYMYFNITFTRADTFWKGAIVFIILAIIAYIYEMIVDKNYKLLFIKDTEIYRLPELWMGIFLIANLMAFINAEDKYMAWTGQSGRFFGLKMILIIAVMFFFLSRRCYLNIVNYIAGLAVSIFAVVIAYLQHFGGDPFKWRELIVENQQELFISLFGNINTYGSFLAMAIPAVVAVMIFAKEYWVRCVSGAGVFLLAIGVLPAKSDNVYLGVGVAMIILLFLSIKYKHLMSYMLSCVFMIAGLLFMAYENHTGKGSQKHINGLAEIIENPKIMLAMFIGILILAGLIFILNKKFILNMDEEKTKKLMIILGIVLAVLFVGFCIFGYMKKLSFFVFNDKWGTFRGYIWRRSVSLYLMADPWHKLFGYGNETIKVLMSSHFYDEMLEVTKRTYDNSHNELLQYLVTTGLIGMVSYIGLFITGMKYLIKNLEDNPAVAACLAAAAGYWVQGIVYLNQPITTPLYFVMMAAGIGYVRYRKKKDTV